MSNDAAIELGEFFDYVWGTTEDWVGQDPWVYLPLKNADGSFEKAFFHWPRQRKGVINWVLKHAALPVDVYYSPALFTRASAKKEYVKGSWLLWVDFDGNAPTEWPEDIAPLPTLIVRSSLPENQHCYWLLDEFVTDTELLEDRNRALALALKADTSGWDADQLLRMPHTINRKRNLPVEIVRWER
jgi:hypothetical protein